jgi:hypothetical protein
VRRGEQHSPDAGGLEVEAMSPAEGQAAALLTGCARRCTSGTSSAGQMFSLQTTM